MTRRNDDLRKNRDHSTVKIGKNILKSPEDLKRLAVTYDVSVPRPADKPLPRPADKPKHIKLHARVRTIISEYDRN